jgi:L-ascorbate metabolism protein UlaG (beta-lactamase superfamily)
MPVNVTWTGHSTFLITSDAGTILLDPFFDECPTASMKACDVSCDAILLTHAHFDHIADAAAIANRTGAKVFCCFEIANWLERQGVTNVQAMNHGGTVKIPGGTARMEIAFHSSSLPDGTYGGNPAGWVLDLEGKRIYVAGDTSVFSDMERIGRARHGNGLDLAILPIGDLYTMGPEESLEAIRLLRPAHVLPCHYGTWPPIAQDANAWAESIRREQLAEPHVLTPGASFTLA